MSDPLLDLGRLPIPGPQFVGREAELARLDKAWEDPATHVLTLVAFGGVGKSALVARWIDRMAADGWRGAPAAAPSSRALALWQEKLAFLEEEEAIAVEATQKFALKKQIEEARQKVREHGG